MGLRCWRCNDRWGNGDDTPVSDVHRGCTWVCGRRWCILENRYFLLGSSRPPPLGCSLCNPRNDLGITSIFILSGINFNACISSHLGRIRWWGCVLHRYLPECRKTITPYIYLGKSSLFDRFMVSSFITRLAGLEPATFGLETQRSIH